MKVELMKEAIKESRENQLNNFKEGGPFGAVIEKNGKIIARAHNTVISSKDPTAHAEINAIRMASQTLNTHDLSGCTLYASTQPCPMCLSAIIWANIGKVYYANTSLDAKKIGFKDDMIYDFIKNNTHEKILDMIHIEDIDALKVFEDYKNNNGKIPY